MISGIRNLKYLGGTRLAMILTPGLNADERQSYRYYYENLPIRPKGFQSAFSNLIPLHLLPYCNS
jgi:hypothetical protein